MQRKTVIDSKAIEVTLSNVFPITNVTVRQENTWKSNNDVLKNKVDDA